MHPAAGSVVKYSLWFLFAVVLGSFLIGFAKFGFNPTLYIDYLNSISVSQLFSDHEESTISETLTGDTTNLSGEDDMYTTDLDQEIFGQTGMQKTGSQVTGSSSTESFGFVKNLETGYQAAPTGGNKAVVVTPKAQPVTGDSRKDLLNLIKSKEQ